MRRVVDTSGVYAPSPLHGFAEWLDGHAWSTALHESLWMYPLIESTHVLSLMLFVGMLAMVDLRMLGWAFRQTPVSELTGRLLPWSVAGFVVMVSTGVLLFYAIPVRTAHSVWFRVKVVLLLLAAVNAWWFHRRVSRDRQRWDGLRKPPLPVRLTAAFSLSLWAGVIVAGRMIAYNWFDCGRGQSAFVAWAAGCAVELAETAP